MEQFDVVVVGGGIAGSALAAEVARSDVSVLVLERVVEFRDKVRGEYLQPWGAVEMVRLGLTDVLTGAGGGWCRLMVGYSEHLSPADAEALAVPLDQMAEGAAGGFCVGHPQASDALNRAAGACGAVVRRGVEDVTVRAGAQPAVAYTHEGVRREARCRIVVGADGRHSTVRKALGVQLHTVESGFVLGGLLVRADGWPVDTAIIGVSGDHHFLAFPRPDGYVRLYSCRQPSPETAGAQRARHLQASFQLACVPGSEMLAQGEQAGPCAYAMGSDAWTDRPAVDGAVLVGDAAGWNDPILGCGLSIALRDARSVADVLTGGDGWTPEAFEPYVVERAERMRRLRMCAHLSTQLHCTFTMEGRARRAVFRDRMMSNPLVRGLRTISLVGPEQAPAASFTDDTMAQALAPA